MWRIFKLLDFRTDIDKIVSLSSTSIILTNTVGISRSILALCTLITFVFNSSEILFPQLILDSNEILPWHQSISLFNILSTNLFLAKFISIIILITIVLGFLPRYLGILHWYIAYSFFVSSPLIDGGDQITAILTLLLIPITLVDNRKNHFQNSNQVISPYINILLYSILVVIKLQIAILYFNSATAKFAVDEWMNGTALYYWILHPIYGASPWLADLIKPFLLNSYFIAVSTWGVLLFEILLSFTFLVAKDNLIYRKRMLLFGICFHFFIFVLFGLASFGLAMTGALILFCMPIGHNFSFLNKQNDTI